jgi:hypothetical protein
MEIFYYMTERNRLSRYVRKKGAFASMTIRENDRAILRLVNAHRFLSTDLIARLLDTGQDTAVPLNTGRDGKKRPANYSFGTKALYKRLQGLFHEGYLQRHHLTDQPIGRGFGSSPAIYGLGGKGADILAEELGIPATELKKVVEQNKVRLFDFR